MNDYPDYPGKPVGPFFMVLLFVVLLVGIAYLAHKGATCHEYPGVTCHGRKI